MRKKQFLLLLSLITFSTLQAQVKLGAKVGGNLTTLDESGDIFFATEFERKVEFHFGVFTQIQLSEHFLFQPELLYNRKGTFANAHSPNKNDEDYDLNYLNLPLLLGYSPIENFNILVGPEVGYLLNAKIRDNSSDSDVTERFNQKDVGIAIGLEYQMDAGLGFGIRYTHGLSYVENLNVTRTNVDGTQDELNSKWKNRTFQLYISYAFLR
jgi:hypothetical protein